MCRSSSAGTWVGSMFEADQRGWGGWGYRCAEPAVPGTWMWKACLKLTKGTTSVQNLLSGYLGGVGNMFEAHTRTLPMCPPKLAVWAYTWGTPRRTHGPESETGQYNNKRETRGEIF
jgi:hypothetical protein